MIFLLPDSLPKRRPTSSFAGMMPPYRAQGEVPRIPLLGTRVNKGPAVFWALEATVGVTLPERCSDASPYPPTFSSSIIRCVVFGDDVLAVCRYHIHSRLDVCRV